MKNKTPLFTWIIGFILLNLYVNGLPKVFQLDVLPWLGYAVGFFIVAHLLAKYVLKLKGLPSLGLQRHKSWVSFMLLGFILGFATWAVKYLVFWGVGKFEITGTMGTGFILGMLTQAFLGMFFASAINDVLIRGYWLAYFRKSDMIKWYLLLTTILYVLDDAWNAGFSLTNSAFSAVLGVSLAYTVLKTGSVWMAIGIHWGGNMMYRAMSGFNGQGIWKLEQVKDGLPYELISIVITALLLPVLYLLLRNRKSEQTIAEQQLVPTSEFAA